MRSKEVSGMPINYMDPQRFDIQVATVIGGDTRIITRKDMEQRRGLVEADTSGNGCRISDTAMEYTDGQMEEYTMDNENKIIKMAMHITGRQMATNTMDSLKMI
jgi:hypothetical protein